MEVSQEYRRRKVDGIRVGAFYSYILGKNENVSLSVVARSNYEVVKKKVYRGLRPQ